MGEILYSTWSGYKPSERYALHWQKELLLVGMHDAVDCTTAMKMI